MRRGLMVVLGLLAATAGLTATPAPVKAQDLPGALIGVITRPLGAILGGQRYGRRSYKARKASRPPAPVAAQTRPAIASPATAAAGAAAIGTAAAVTAGTTSAEAKPADTKPADTAIDKAVASPAGPAQTATPVAATTAPVATTPLPAVAPAPSSAPAPAASAPAARTPAATAAVTEPKPEARPAAPATTAATPTPAPTPAPTQRSAAVAQPGEAAPPRSAEQPPARQQPTAAPAPPRTWLRLGVTGPLTWPTALEDVLGFTLWPGEYSERLRAHGIGDVMNAVMVPASALAARLRPTQTTARADMRQPPAPGGSLGVCNLAPASEDWPAAQIERAVELNTEQRAALAQLTTAFGEAAVRIRAACRDEASPSSADRLRTMQAMLWAVHDSAIQLRAPLAKFYGSLTDQQRQKFAAPASAQADPRSMTPAAIARLCGAPQSNEGMVRQAEQSLNLNRAQRASLDAFQKKSAEMGQFLMASCLRPVASTPVERIDAAADRLTALIFAASTVNLALNDFYNQLDAGQRTKFDSAVR